MFPNRPPRRHSLDLSSRVGKARKIERLLNIEHKTGLSVLEIGCGSGAISQYLGQNHTVDAVDVVDSRLVFDNFRFQVVPETSLPFEDQSFDVVISNQVIEHVGARPAQEDHLAEIRRVMRPTGIGYLAVPNRWRLIEPHYHLPLLSVVSERWRSRYLRVIRGLEYDCRPLGPREIERMLRDARLRYRPLSSQAVKAAIEIEHRSWLFTPLAHLPAGVMPSLIYRLERQML